MTNPLDEGDVRIIREALEYYSMMAAKNADREGHVGYLLDDALAALERVLLPDEGDVKLC